MPKTWVREKDMTAKAKVVLISAVGVVRPGSKPTRFEKPMKIHNVPRTGSASQGSMGRTSFMVRSMASNADSTISWKSDGWTESLLVRSRLIDYYYTHDEPGCNDRIGNVHGANGKDSFGKDTDVSHRPDLLM